MDLHHMNGYTMASGLVWFLVFLFSVTFHEASHAFVAWRGGDSTAYHGGQVSLSPFPHMMREPLGMLIVPLVTALTQGWAIGWASTPYDPRWAARYPKRTALMSPAGPFATLVLSFVAFALAKIGNAAGWFVTSGRSYGELLSEDGPYRDFLFGSPDGSALYYPEQILLVVLFLNVLLFAFNLIPFPPMDGGAAIGLILPDNLARGLRDLRQTPYLSLIGLVIAYFAFPYVAGPLLRLVRHLLIA